MDVTPPLYQCGMPEELSPEATQPTLNEEAGRTGSTACIGDANRDEAGSRQEMCLLSRDRHETGYTPGAMTVSAVAWQHATDGQRPRMVIGGFRPPLNDVNRRRDTPTKALDMAQ